MSTQTWVFIALVGNHLAAAVVFLAVYRLLNWRASEISRHLMWWVAVLAVGDAAWLLAILFRVRWMAWALFGTIALAGALGWYRDWLVLRSVRLIRARDRRAAMTQEPEVSDVQ